MLGEKESSKFSQKPRRIVTQFQQLLAKNPKKPRIRENLEQKRGDSEKSVEMGVTWGRNRGEKTGENSRKGPQNWGNMAEKEGI